MKLMKKNNQQEDKAIENYRWSSLPAGVADNHNGSAADTSPLCGAVRHLFVLAFLPGLCLEEQREWHARR